MKLEGKVAIVTAGGGPGIGQSIVRALADEGAAVTVADINRYRAEALVDELTTNGQRGLAVVADVSRKIDAERIVAETIRAFGTVSILINHAGIQGLGRIEDLTEEKWRRVLGAHLDGTFFCTQAVIPAIRAQQWGRIVSTSSRAAYRSSRNAAEGGLSSYAAAKAGIIGFSRSAAQELGPFGITVNVVAPGLVSGSGMKGEPQVMSQQDEIKQSLEENQVLPPRYIRPHEIAAAVMYFVGPGSDRTTGQVLHVNGGSYFNA